MLQFDSSSTTVPELIEALHTSPQSTRRQAIKALGNSGSSAAASALLSALADEHEPQSGPIFDALVNLGHVAVPALLAGAQDPASRTRWQSIRVLGEMHDTRALPVLVHALLDRDRGVAWMAAKGLVPFGEESIEPILNLLTTSELKSNSWLRETSAYVLHWLTKARPDLKPYLDPLLQELHHSYYKESASYTALKTQEQLQRAGLITLGYASTPEP